MHSTNKPPSKNKTVRVCAAQYQMQVIQSWSQIEEQVTYFVNVAQRYQAQFLLFPEYFGVQYFSCLPKEWTDKEMLSALVEKHDQYKNMFKVLAKEHQLFIMGGSQPVRKEDGHIYNIAHLFTPSGNIYTQEKLHITPTEREIWGYHSGDGFKLFDTPFGRIGIQVCYDIEFPEVSRMMALNGAEIIFTPFYTGDIYGYQRVRYSAQARAVENYIYTAISGSCGSLPVPSNLICYSQSAIFTPSDVGFPSTAIAAEALPNQKTVVVADLNLDYLQKIRETGTVKPLQDRREDIYCIHSNIPVEIVQVD